VKGLGKCATLAACSLLAVLALAVPAHAAFPGANGKIAFVDSEDIWTVNPDGTGRTNLTNAPGSDAAPAWSADGTRIAFMSRRDGDWELWLMNADGTGQVQRTVNSVDDTEPAWSPDGTHLLFVRQGHIWRMTAGGFSSTQLTVGAVGDSEPAWSPSGVHIAFSRFDAAVANDIDVYRMNADGTGVTRLTTTTTADTSPDWAPDELLLVYRTGTSIATMKPDGSGRLVVPPNMSHYLNPVWAPRNYDLAVQDFSSVVTISEIGTVYDNVTIGAAPSWQPLPPAPIEPGYPRPRGATPIRVSLVPSYRPCDSPDREHGPPLAFQSCASPAPTSDYLTVGSPDSNGQPAKFTGSILVQAIPGNFPPQDADVHLRADIADVRCKVEVAGSCSGLLSDYTGQLQALFSLRITDKENGHAQIQPATVTDFFQFPFTVGCAATADTTIGGSCSMNTSVQALIPGTLTEGKRAIWQVGQVQVWDGGADGQASSDDNTPFLTQGLFVP
jgi:hypothetical protein